MRILAFTDLHGSSFALKKIEETCKKDKPDLLVCSGDISVFSRGINKIFQKLSKIKKDVLIVPGNHESPDEIERTSAFFKSLIHIHKKAIIREDVLFIGYGGGGFSKTDSNLERFMKKYKSKEYQSKKIVFVTHAPPYKTELDYLYGESCGCKSIRKVIEEIQPDYCICGHLHECSGKKDTIGKTIIINPGPKGMIFSI